MLTHKPQKWDKALREGRSDEGDETQAKRERKAHETPQEKEARKAAKKKLKAEEKK